MFFPTSTADGSVVTLRSHPIAGGTENFLAQELMVCASAAAFGVTLGLSAPGLEQWYLVWFGMVPLLVLTVTAKEPWSAWWRGLCFGTGYNLVYLMWYLSVRSVFLTGVFAFAPTVMRLFFWLSMSVWQGIFVGIFSCILRAIPMTGGWIPAKKHGRWLAPSFIVVPLLWLLIVERLGNAPEVLGVPWSMLQYSQYRQLAFLQIASIIGGAGIGVCIMLANVTILGCLGWQRKALCSVSYTSYKLLFANTGITTAVLLLVFTFGFYRVSFEGQLRCAKEVQVSAIQANLVRKIHRVSSLTILKNYLGLTMRLPPGICVWPEWVFGVDYTKSKDILNAAACVAKRFGQSWVLGIVDSGGVGKEFNAVCALDKNGTVSPNIYYKRYLVPFGEYTPDWVRHSVIGFLLYGFKGNMEHTDAGELSTVFKLKDAPVSPVICWESMIPRLVSDGVRSGAELIVDCSNTSWFHKSILSDQLVSFCVMRAVENHRPFVFATTLGPSTIIDSIGRIVTQAPSEHAAAITAKVALHRDLTPFSPWCF